MSEDLHQQARKEMARAIRRLNALEYVILAGILILALLGGALLAILLEAGLGFPFRLTWIVGSLLLFVLPGVVVLGREKGWGRAAPAPDEEETNASVERGHG